MSKAIFAGAALLAFAAPYGGAYATCTQADLKGNWAVYSLTSSFARNVWSACTISIDAVGNILPVSSCGNSLTPGLPAQAGGTIKLASSQTCTVTGTIRLPSYSETDKISRLTLSMNKQVAQGVGLFNGDAPFLVTMTKVQ